MCCTFYVSSTFFYVLRYDLKSLSRECASRKCASKICLVGCNLVKSPDENCECRS